MLVKELPKERKFARNAFLRDRDARNPVSQGQSPSPKELVRERVSREESRVRDHSRSQSKKELVKGTVSHWK